MSDTIKLYGSIKVSSIPVIEDKSIAKNLGGLDVNKALNYGQVEVIVSNSAIDRHGESIRMEGIDTKQVMKNPVLLWGHDYESIPIGRIIKLWKSQGNLMARIELDYDIDEFADKVYKKIIRGSINAVSIGGIVKQWNEDYTVIEKMEMIELSLVTIGAHQDALVTSKSLEESFIQLAKVLNHKESIETVEEKPKTILITI